VDQQGRIIGRYSRRAVVYFPATDFVDAKPFALADHLQTRRPCRYGEVILPVVADIETHRSEIEVVPVINASDRDSYSSRKTAIGSTPAARLAGKYAAETATTANSTPTIAKVQGSVAFTP
jgi:hypothetical protein